MAHLLGIDPGYGRCGWAVIDDSLEYIDCGVIETKPDDEKRLLIVYSSLSDIITKFKPVSCGMEKLFFNKNSKTALPVAQVIGVIKLLLTQHDLAYAEYTPVQVKQSITGYGGSSKEQLERMIKKIVKIPAIAQHDDAFDALAIAICHSLALPRCTALKKIILPDKRKNSML